MQGNGGSPSDVLQMFLESEQMIVYQKMTHRNDVSWSQFAVHAHVSPILSKEISRDHLLYFSRFPACHNAKDNRCFSCVLISLPLSNNLSDNRTSKLILNFIFSLQILWKYGVLESPHVWKCHMEGPRCHYLTMLLHADSGVAIAVRERFR